MNNPGHSTSKFSGAWITRFFKRSRNARALDFECASEEICKALGQSLPSLEQHFLDISQRLEPLIHDSEVLTKDCESLIYLASGRKDGHNILLDTLNILAGPLKHIDRCQSEQGHLVSLITRCEEKTEGILRIRESMHDILAPLAYLTVLFKIESARLPEDLKETFTTVTNEIDRLRRLVDETFTINARELDRARQTLHDVRTRFLADLEHHAEAVTAKRTQIEKSIATLNAQLSNNDERDLRIQAQGRIVADEIAQIVEGLQFQDIIQQKCNHITASLKPNILRSGRQVKLQASQLESVLKDLNLCTDKISTGLNNIEHETSRFDEICLKMDGIESMVASSDGMVQMLLDVVGEVGEVINVLADLTTQASQTLTPLGDFADTLSSAVVELSIEMRLIALNAQIRSVQSGEGTGLEQLSASTAEISDETTKLTGNNFDELHVLRESIRDMLHTFADFQASGRAEIDRFNAQREEIEDRLHQMRDETLDAFGTTSGTLDRIRQSSQSVRKQMDDIPAIIESIKFCIDALNTLYDRYGESFGNDEKTEDVAMGYTMASQHAVHAEVYGTTFQANDTSVELFGLDSPPPAPSVKTMQKMPPHAVTPPAGTRLSPTPLSPAQSTRTAPDLGNNAELF